MSRGWSGGSTRAWRRLRRTILDRDGNLCQLQLPGTCVRTSAPMHVHHVHGKESGCPGCRADHPAHLQAACAPCNLQLGDPSRTGDPPAVPVTPWG